MVELDDIVAAIEWCTRVWPQGRVLMEGYERVGRKREADTGVGTAAGARGAAATILATIGAGTGGAETNSVEGRVGSVEVLAMGRSWVGIKSQMQR